MIAEVIDMNPKGKKVRKIQRIFTDDGEDPPLRPEFIDELRRAEKEKRIAISIDDFAKEFGLKKQRKC